MTEPYPPIRERTIGAYLDALASGAPTPGGGSAAGVIGTLSASLGQMVLALTDLGSSGHREALESAEARLAELRERFTSLAEEDEAVYGAYMAATTLPKGTGNEKAARRAAMQEALKHAASVPLRACEAALELARALEPVHEHGNRHLRSDARIALLCATTCFAASRSNVEANLAMIRDEAWVSATSTRVDELAAQIEPAETRAR